MILPGRGLLAAFAMARPRRRRFIDAWWPGRAAPPRVAAPWSEDLARDAEEAGDAERAERIRREAQASPPMSPERARRGAAFRRLVDRDED